MSSPNAFERRRAIAQRAAEQYVANPAVAAVLLAWARAAPVRIMNSAMTQAVMALTTRCVVRRYEAWPARRNFRVC
jgi:hypothetical protein